MSTHFDHGLRRQAIVEAVLADVFGGRLRAGQHLVTRELAARFGVSDTPIREALVALAGIGVIDLLPNRGAVVRPVSAKDVLDICQVRRALECEAVRSACRKADQAEFESIAEELRQLQQVAVQKHPKFVERARQADSRLHDAVMLAADNPYLVAELNRLKLLYRAFRDLNYTQDEVRNDHRRLRTEADEHLAIVEAILTRDRRKATQAMSIHIRNAAKYWCRAIRLLQTRLATERQEAET